MRLGFLLHRSRSFCAMADAISDSTALRRASAPAEDAGSSMPPAKKQRSILSQSSSVVAMIVEQSEEQAGLVSDEISEVAKQDGTLDEVEQVKPDAQDLTGDELKQDEAKEETRGENQSAMQAREDPEKEDEAKLESGAENQSATPGEVQENPNESLAEASANGAPGEAPKPLSKSALKKMKKQEKYALKKKEMKAREKEVKKERREKKSQDWTNLSAEEKEAAVERCKEARRTRVEESNKKKEKLRKAMESGQNLVIDFQFTEQMTEQEIAHMGQQIMYSYAANAKAEVPVRLSLTSLQGGMKQQLEKISGNENWLVHREERGYIEVFSDRKQDLIYLTADSENVLSEIEDSKVYIIGGMVDHNRMKCITLNRAKEQGIATARLPIQENMKLSTSTVLTVNQVVEIVLEFLNCRDWAQTLKTIIPQRKVAQ